MKLEKQIIVNAGAQISLFLELSLIFGILGQSVWQDIKDRARKKSLSQVQTSAPRPNNLPRYSSFYVDGQHCTAQMIRLLCKANLISWWGRATGINGFFLEASNIRAAKIFYVNLAISLPHVGHKQTNKQRDWTEKGGGSKCVTDLGKRKTCQRKTAKSHRWKMKEIDRYEKETLGEET